MEAGGESLRINYPLGKDAMVFDVGGYVGDFVSDIIQKFDCKIDVFEPVRQYAEEISERFANNGRVHVVQAGLGGSEREEIITISGLGSSVFGDGAAEDEKEKIRIISAVEYIQTKGYSIIDLMKINIEGGEYELLNSLLDQPDLVKGVRYFQIQFHDFVPGAQKLRSEIQKKLSKTHNLMWNFPFIWECWERKQK